MSRGAREHANQGDLEYCHPVFHVYSHRSRSAVAEPAWADSARQRLLCPECRDMLRLAELPDVPLKEPAACPIDFVSSLGLGVISVRLLDELGREEMQEYLRFGRLFDSRGRLSRAYVSFQGKHRTFFRGTEESTYRGVCSACGSPRFYAAGGLDDRYLLRRRLPSVPVSESQVWGLILTKEYLNRISAPMRRRLRINPLPVIDEPKDGLGDLPF